MALKPIGLLPELIVSYNFPGVVLNSRLVIELENTMNTERFKEFLSKLSAFTGIGINLYISGDISNLLPNIIINIGRMIKYINFEGSHNSEEILQLISETSVSEVSISKPDFEILSKISKFTSKLQKLGISGASISTLDIPLDNLVSLNISNIKFTETALFNLLKGTPRLKHLLANTTPLRDFMITHLNLETLHIENCDFPGDSIPDVINLNIIGVNFNTNIYSRLSRLETLYTDQFDKNLSKSLKNLTFNCLIEFENIFWILDHLELQSLEFKSPGLFPWKFEKSEILKLVDNSVNLEAHDRLKLRDHLIKEFEPSWAKSILVWKYSSQELLKKSLEVFGIKLFEDLEIVTSTSNIIPDILRLPYRIRLTIDSDWRPDYLILAKTIKLHTKIPLEWKSLHIYNITIEGVNLTEVPECLELTLINCIFDDKLAKRIAMLPRVKLISCKGYTLLGFLSMNLLKPDLPKISGATKLSNSQLLQVIPILDSIPDSNDFMIECLDLLDPVGIINPKIIKIALKLEHSILDVLLPKFDIHISEFIEIKSNAGELLNLVPELKKYFNKPAMLTCQKIPDISWVPDYLITEELPKVSGFKILELRRANIKISEFKILLKPPLETVILNGTNITLSDLADLETTIEIKTVNTNIGNVGGVKNLPKLLSLTNLPEKFYEYIQFTRENLSGFTYLGIANPKLLRGVFQYIGEISSGEIKIEQSYDKVTLLLVGANPREINLFSGIWEIFKPYISKLELRLFYEDNWCNVLDINPEIVMGLELRVQNGYKKFPISSYKNLQNLTLYGYCIEFNEVKNLNIRNLETDNILNLSEFTRLETLGVSGYSTLDLDIFKKISLENLSIEGYKLIGCPEIKLPKLRLSGVEFLNFGFSGITRLELVHIKIPNLSGILELNPGIRFLNLSCSHFQTFPITRLSKLSYLNLSMCHWILDEDLKPLIEMKLGTLDLSGCLSITIDIIYEFVSKGLTGLILTECELIPKNIREIFKSEKLLNSMDISIDEELIITGGDKEAYILTKSKPKITSLKIKSNLGDRIIELIPTFCPNIRRLILKSTNLQTPGILDKFCNNLISLDTLEFQNSQFTQEHLEVISKLELTSLILRKCEITTEPNLTIPTKVRKSNFNPFCLLNIGKNIELDKREAMELQKLRTKLGINDIS